MAAVEEAVIIVEWQEEAHNESRLVRKRQTHVNIVCGGHGKGKGGAEEGEHVRRKAEEGLPRRSSYSRVTMEDFCV